MEGKRKIVALYDSDWNVTLFVEGDTEEFELITLVQDICGFDDGQPTQLVNGKATVFEQMPETLQPLDAELARIATELKNGKGMQLVSVIYPEPPERDELEGVGLDI